MCFKKSRPEGLEGRDVACLASSSTGIGTRTAAVDTDAELIKENIGDADGGTVSFDGVI